MSVEKFRRPIAVPYIQTDSIGTREDTSSLLKYTDVTITSAQVLALFATPRTLVAAPGAGLATIFDGAVVTKAAGSAYAGIAAGEDLIISYTNAAGLAVAGLEPVGLLDQTTAQVRFVKPYHIVAATVVSDITPVANAALVLHLLLAEVTTGNTDLKFRIYYRVIPTVLN